MKKKYFRESGSYCPCGGLARVPRGGVAGTHVTSVSYLLFMERGINIHCWTILQQCSRLFLCHAVNAADGDSSREPARRIASVAPNNPFIVMRQVDNPK